MPIRYEDITDPNTLMVKGEEYRYAWKDKNKDRDVKDYKWNSVSIDRPETILHYCGTLSTFNEIFWQKKIKKKIIG